MLRAPVVLIALSIFSLQTTIPAISATVPQSKITSSQPTPQADSAAGNSLTGSRFSEDPAAEDELLNQANRSRTQTGVPPLRADRTLREAARQHALRIVETELLEHQFPGEPALLERIAIVNPQQSQDAVSNDRLRIDRAGENLAFSNCSSGAHDALMRSVPHRENLLNREFSLAGIAAFWRNGKLYVVEDFAREIPAYSAEQNRTNIGRAIHTFRQSAGLSTLNQQASINDPALEKLDQAACSLAREEHPNARLLNASYDSQSNDGRKIVTYTQSEPSALPAGALRLLENPDLKQFAVGTCFARNAAYPTGTYWVAIVLY
jgi:uncharacterized protein YkwD